MRAFARVAHGARRLLAGVAAAKALDFALYLLLARALGVEDFGHYTFALSFVLLFSVLADLGLGTVFVREVVRRPNEIPILVRDALLLKLVLGALVLAAIAVFIPWNAARAGGPLPLVIFAVGLALQSCAVLFDQLLKATGRAGRSGLVLIAESAVELALAAGLLSGGLGVFGAAAAYALSAAVHLLVSAWLTRKHLVLRVDPRSRAAAWGARIQLLREAFPLALSGIFIAIYFRIDAVMLGWLRDPHAVGVYGGAYRLFEAFSPFAAAFQSVLFPVLVRTVADRAEFGRLVGAAFRWQLAIGLGLAVIGGRFASNLIHWILGPAYAASADVLTLLLWALPFALLAGTAFHLSTARGLQSRAAWAVGGAAALNVALNAWWIPLFSFVGAAAATVFTEAVSFALLWRLLGGERPALHLAASAWRPAAAAAVLAASLWLVPRSIGPIAEGLVLIASPLIYVVLLGLTRAVPIPTRTRESNPLAKRSAA